MADVLLLQQVLGGWAEVQRLERYLGDRLLCELQPLCQSTTCQFPKIKHYVPHS